MALKEMFVIKEAPEGADDRSAEIWRQLGELAVITSDDDKPGNFARVIIEGDHGFVEFTIEFDENRNIIDIWN